MKEDFFRLPAFCPFCRRLMITLLITYIFFVLIQDLFLYPRLLNNYFSDKTRHSDTIPKNFESFFFDTDDGNRTEAWYLPAENHTNDTPVAIVFHGNAGMIDHFIHIQRWLRNLGISSWAMEYRGFGKSTGWPREGNIYADSRALLRFIGKRRTRSISKLVVVGSSLGSGPAAYMAQKFKADVLVTFAAYTSIPNVARLNPVYRMLLPFAWTEFPVKKYISRLTNTCVVAAHGRWDRTIPFKHLSENRSAYTGSGGFYAIPEENAGHNLFRITKGKAAKKLISCLQKIDSPVPVE